MKVEACFFPVLPGPLVEKTFLSPLNYLEIFCWKLIKLFTNGLPRWHSGKESACQCRRRQFDLWVRKIPWRRKWQPALVFLPGKFHGQRALTGYTVHGVAELYITYQLSNNSIYKHTHIFFIVLCRYYIVFCFVLQMEGWW